MSIRWVCKVFTFLKERGTWLYNVYVKMSCYWGEGDIAKVWVCKDVMLLREKWRIGYNELHKGVKFLGENLNIAVMRVLKYVRLLGEKGNATILKVHKEVITG